MVFEQVELQLHGSKVHSKGPELRLLNECVALASHPECSPASQTAFMEYVPDPTQSFPG